MGKFEEKEKEMKLSPAEERRQAHFEDVAAQLKEQGYRRTDLTISIIKANLMIALAAIPLLILDVVLFILIHPEYDYVHGMLGAAKGGLLVFCLVFMVLVVVHELVHGITWSLFCKNGFKDIEFGVKWEVVTPYCTCKTPLKKNHYILGALMPLIVLGIIPMGLGLAFGSLFVSIVGVMMILSAGGDILITRELLKFKPEGKDVVIYDHPSMPGSIIFDR